MAKQYKENPAAKSDKTETVKSKRAPKFISQLAGGIGWVGFTKYQMEQLGIDPAKSLTKDLRIKVHTMLKLKAREPKEEKKAE